MHSPPTLPSRTALLQPARNPLNPPPQPPRPPHPQQSYYYEPGRRTGSPAAGALAELCADLAAAAARPARPALLGPRIPELLEQLGAAAEAGYGALFEAAVAVESAGALARRYVLTGAVAQCMIGFGAAAARMLLRDKLVQMTADATREWLRRHRSQLA
jgi:hypothetical protein